MTATVHRLLSGGHLVSDGSAFPRWFADRDKAKDEAAAINNSPTGPSGIRLLLGSPEPGRSGSTTEVAA